MNYSVLSLLFAIQFLAARGADDILKGKFKVDITELPANIHPAIQNYNTHLTKQGIGNNFPVAVSYHHIIPFHHLANFYNKLVKNKEANKLRTTALLKIYQQFSQFYRQKGENEGNKNKYDKAVKNVRKFVLGLYMNKVVYDESGKRPENFDEFQSYFSWVPGNLFIGPNKRSDDPGEQFDKYAKRIVGSTRFDNLKNIYDMMQSYIDGKKVDFSKLSNGLKDMVNYSEPQALKSSDWVLNADGSYKIKA